MSEPTTHCDVCSSLIDEEDLFCANCGTEAPVAEGAGLRHDGARIATHNFQCSGCGASMSYDAAARSLRCPFCGSVELAEKRDERILAPARVVPFGVGRAQALAAMRQWLGKGFWRPSDLSEQAAVVHMTPVYVPYWVFRARTHTYWTADTSHTPPGARGDWFPLTGEHGGEYDGLLVGASGALRSHETAQLCPFNLAAGVPPEQVDLDNVTVEQFTLPRKYARPLAQQGIEEGERQACAVYAPARSRNVKVNVLVESRTSEPVLLPVWIMAYRYQDRVFRFLVNGQTGRASGTAPTSWKKVGAAVAAGVMVLIVLLAFLAAAIGVGALL